MNNALEIPAMDEGALEKVRRLEEANMKRPQVPIDTSHVFHGGIYTRTVRIPAGATITGALIKIPTTLVVSGEVDVFVGDHVIHLAGYNVIPASAGRKQAFHAYSETFLSMSFPTKATIVEQAEAEFTDDFDRLLSRIQPEHNQLILEGETLCLES